MQKPAALMPAENAIKTPASCGLFLKEEERVQDSMYKMRVTINGKIYIVSGNSPEEVEMRAQRLISEKTDQAKQKED